MSRAGAFIGGALAATFVGAVLVVPIAMSASSLFPGADDLKEGVELASCGSEAKIQQVSRSTPKVAGWSQTQVANAATIVKVGQDMKIPPRGWVIAVATAMQESTLRNLGNLGDRNDHDSLGLFQQRPSQGWGTPDETRDPVHASTMFYKKLRTIKGWQEMRLTQAAQRVQNSAYPNAYQKWEDDASNLVDALSDGAAQTPANAPVIGKCAAHTEQVASSGWVRPVKGEIGDGWHSRGGEHQGVDLIANKGTPIYAAADGIVIHMECDRTERGYDCSHDGGSGDWPGGCGWYVDIRHAGNIITRYCHMRDKPLVGENDKVKAGQQIGVVGSTGHSSGPHLHFEVHKGSRDASSTTDPVTWMKDHGAPLGVSAKGGEQAT